MFTRLAACVLSVGLLTNAAVAHGFAQAPDHATEVAARRVPAVDRAQVKQALAKRRAHNLASFRAYRKAGVYPHNFVRPGPLNVWIDPEGHLCAAATMISKDGKHDLVIDIGQTDNQIRLLNVTGGALLDWMLTSGFTIEEIDRIQMPGFGQEWPRRPLEAPDWTAEDARLRRAYAATDAWLVKHAKSGLDKAVDRLMQHPQLARKLVDGTL
jgi:hypothetical protein